MWAFSRMPLVFRTSLPPSGRQSPNSTATADQADCASLTDRAITVTEPLNQLIQNMNPSSKPASAL